MVGGGGEDATVRSQPGVICEWLRKKLLGGTSAGHRKIRTLMMMVLKSRRKGIRKRDVKKLFKWFCRSPSLRPP